MFPNTRVHIRDSIATKLLKAIFVFYIVIAVAVTFFHIAAEYYYMKVDVYHELKDLQATFEPIIATALWHCNKDQLESAGSGIPFPMSVNATTAISSFRKTSAVRVPLPSIACRALWMRFVQTWFSSSG